MMWYAGANEQMNKWTNVQCSMFNGAAALPIRPFVHCPLFIAGSIV